MKHEFLVYLSKEWRPLTRQCRHSAEKTAEVVGEHVRAMIEQRPDVFPAPVSFLARSINAYYTPTTGSPPWEWWDRVHITYQTVESDSKPLTEILATLKTMLPPNTHLEG